MLKEKKKRQQQAAPPPSALISKELYSTQITMFCTKEQSTMFCTKEQPVLLLKSEIVKQIDTNQQYQHLKVKLCVHKE
jgi:hypothetical protein